MLAHLVHLKQVTLDKIVRKGLIISNFSLLSQVYSMIILCFLLSSLLLLLLLLSLLLLLLLLL